jgi:hypothetical protein
MCTVSGGLFIRSVIMSKEKYREKKNDSLRLCSTSLKMSALRVDNQLLCVTRKKNSAHTQGDNYSYSLSNTTTLCGFWLSQTSNCKLSNPLLIPSSAWGCNWASQSEGDINSGDWPSRLVFGRKASDLTLENIRYYEI